MTRPRLNNVAVRGQRALGALDDERERPLTGVALDRSPAAG
jgi:hypothetical protein